jgi:uncharacterized protein (DUF3084 family)
MNEVDILRQRLAQSEQYRRMVAEQHTDAKHNVVHYEQKLTEARAQECELEHRLGVLDVEAERFKRLIAEADGA